MAEFSLDQECIENKKRENLSAPDCELDSQNLNNLSNPGNKIGTFYDQIDQNCSTSKFQETEINYQFQIHQKQLEGIKLENHICNKNKQDKNNNPFSKHDPQNLNSKIIECSDYLKNKTSKVLQTQKNFEEQVKVSKAENLGIDIERSKISNIVEDTLRDSMDNNTEPFKISKKHSRLQINKGSKMCIKSLLNSEATIEDLLDSSKRPNLIKKIDLSSYSDLLKNNSRIQLTGEKQNLSKSNVKQLSYANLILMSPFKLMNLQIQ